VTDLPAYLQNLPSRNLAQTAIANVGAGTPPYLSIQGNRFTLVDIAGNTVPIQTLHVDVIVIDVNTHISKIFFGLNKPYDPDNPTPPVCFSDNGIAPSIGAGQPQSPTCASCAHNVWGSKISQMGSAVKQCADQQKIAVYVPEYSDGIFLLRIPPGSFSNWRAYMAKFAGAGLDPDRVITRISFEQNAVGTLIFQSPSYITEQQTSMVVKMIESKAAEIMIGRLDKPREGALPAPQTVAAIPQAQPIQPAAVLATGPFPQQAAPAAPQAPSAQVTRPFATAPASATASPSNPPQQRRRRTKAEMEAARAAQAHPASRGTQAPFRPDPPPGQATPYTAAMQGAIEAAPNGQFGIVQNPPAPPPGLDLDAVFKLDAVSK
jgi:hypothetical protein